MDIFGLLDGVQAIARNGLNYAQNPYDRERYEKLLDLATASYSELLALSSEELLARFRSELGYVTTKLGVSAGVFDESGNALLARRSDDKLWSLVSGWVDPNETPEETVVRELMEEVGVSARVDQLVGVFTRTASQETGPHSVVSLVYLCSIAPADLDVSHELLEARFAPIVAVNHDDWHPQHLERALRAREVWARRHAVAAE